MKNMKNATKYERQKAKKHRGRHIGGPGKPDYVRGKTNGEVKNWNRPMNKSDVMREVRKGRNEIISKMGFTLSAIEYVKRYRPNIKLYHKNKRIN